MQYLTKQEDILARRLGVETGPLSLSQYWVIERAVSSILFPRIEVHISYIQKEYDVTLEKVALVKEYLVKKGYSELQLRAIVKAADEATDRMHDDLVVLATVPPDFLKSLA